MLGNQHDAEFATLLRHFAPEDPGPVPEAPGWDYLGRGIHRVCFLSPEGVVYKVPRRTATGSAANDHEYNTVEKYATSDALLSAGIRFAECSRYRTVNQDDEVTVLAAEFVGHERPERGLPYDKQSVVSRATGLTDLHVGNVRIDDDGKYVIIDAGH